MSAKVIANYTLNGVDFHIEADNPGQVLASIEQIDRVFKGSRFIGDNDTRYLKEIDDEEPTAIQEHIHIHPIAFPFKGLGGEVTQSGTPYGTEKEVGSSPEDKPKRRGRKPKSEESLVSKTAETPEDSTGDSDTEPNTEESE